MRWSIKIGTIAGIRVEVHVTFVLFVLWIGLAGLAGSAVNAIANVVLILLVFGCVLLHELGHAFAARRYGIRTRDIILLPIGGVARIQRMPEKPHQEMVVAIAGPLVNVVIAALLGLALWTMRIPLVPSEPAGGSPGWAGLGPDPVAGVLVWLFAINVGMIAFNLIPAFPMDGGRVLRAALAARMPYVRATRIAATIGQGIALIFGVVGLFKGLPMLMFVALFVFLAAGEEQALVRTRSTMTGLPARAAMLSEFDVLRADDPLQRAIDLLIAGSQQEFPVLENGRPIGVLTRNDLVRGLQRGGVTSPVRDAIQPDGLVAEPGEPLEEVFQRMREGGRSALPVVSNGDLVGLLTLENVGDLLLVQDALRRHAGTR